MSFSLQTLTKGGTVGAVFFVCMLFAGQAQAAPAGYTEPARNAANGNFITQTFTKAKSPYYIAGGCSPTTLLVNNTITIEPGVVVKFQRPERCGLAGSQAGRILVYGNLVANGTEQDPIIFTSERDDFAGGDTNGDAFLTVPAPSDWGGISVQKNGSSAPGTISLKNAVVRYAGYNNYGLSLSSAISSIVIATTTFSSNENYAIITGAPFAIHGSSFSGNTTGAISAYLNVGGAITEPNVNAKDNWWGDNSGPTIATNPGGTGQKILGANVLYDPWVGKPPERDPVILIPGILGTEMKKGDEVLWLDISRSFFSVGDEFMNPLAMNLDSTPSDSSVILDDVILKKEILPQVSFDYFLGLLNEFKDKGYAENNNLFVFPYDWRLPIETNSENLKQKIDAVLASSHAQKVDLVAHSMGGLVTKKYLFDHPADNKVDTLVLLGVPQLGAPKASKAIMFGDGFDIPGLSENRMKTLATNMPSVYELTPGQEYFSRIGGYYKNLEDNILNFSQVADKIVSKGGNRGLLSAADTFHSTAFDTFVPNNVNIYSVSGCNQSTIGSITERNFYVGNVQTDQVEYNLKPVIGDGTVPLESADALALPADRRLYFTKAEHSKMPSQEGLKQWVANIVAGSPNVQLPSTITLDKSKCALKGKMVTVHSPLDIHITDSAGNHAGAVDGESIENNIPGVSFENIDHNKFVFLPDGESYSVSLIGTGDGVFQMRVSDVDGTVGETVYYNDVPVQPGEAGAVNLGVSSVDTVLSLDTDNNGTQEIIPQSSFLNADQANDFSPPATTVFVNNEIPQDGQNYCPGAGVRFNVEDIGSGVLKTEYSTDSGATWSVYITPIVFSAQGAVNIMYRSVDKAGNREIAKTLALNISSSACALPTEYIILPSADSYIYQYAPGTNYGRSASMQVYPWAPRYTKRGLIKFDLSSIPNNARIASASLNFKESGTYGFQRTIAVHKITKEWTEYAVTWNNIANDFNAQPTATTTLSWDGILGWNSWDVTRDVDQMVHGTAQNYGWMLKDTTEDSSQRYWFFHSRESVNMPYLKVVY